MSKIYIILFLFIYFICNQNIIKAQYFDLGQEPASVKWQQINTKDFRIIFSEDFAGEAKRTANYLSNVIATYPGTIGYKPRKINVIIHNRSVISNAYAAWTPARMEFFTSVPQTTYGQDWLEQLCLHEYRHIAQMGKMQNGAGKIFYYTFGQQATAALFGLFIPSWFMEGDAVSTETAFSESGRGRIPDFEMPLKAQFYEKGLYSFDKAAFGSFKDYVPAEYAFGYLLVAASRMKYGSDLWNKNTSFAARRPYTLTPLSRASKKNTGLKLKNLYKESFKTIDSVWKSSQQYSAECYDDYILSPQKKSFTSYEQNFFIGDSAVCTIKNGLDFERQFVLVSDKKEKKLHVSGYINPVRLASSGENIIFSHNKKFEELLFTANDKFLVWSEVQFDKRWEHRNWSVVKKYNFETRKITHITKKTKYFAPAISPDNKTIAVSEILPEYKFSLVFIDAENGEVIKKFALNNNEVILTPSWSPDSKDIFCVVMNKNGEKGIIRINYETLEYDIILNPSHFEISKPVYDGNYVFFNGVYDGVTNIYALNIASSEIYRVTSAKYGASWASISHNKSKIAFSDYTADGYRTVVIPYDTSKWVKTVLFKENVFPIADILSKQENKQPLNTTNIVDTNFKIKKFRKLANIFKFHSWMPAAYGTYPYEVYPGLNLMSQNFLSNTFLTVNAGYNTFFERPFINSSIVYKGLYPVIEFNYYTGGRKNYFESDLEYDDDFIFWNETVSKLKLSIPLNLTRGKWYRSLNIYSCIENIYWSDVVDYSPIAAYQGDIQAFSAGIDFRNLVKTSEKDIYSRWGQTFSAYYIKSLKPESDNIHYAFHSAFLFPGILKHHNLKLSFSYQFLDGKYYTFPLFVNYPRGYFNYNSNNDIFKYTADYRFPVLYPDANIAGFMYIKRIKASLFCDYANATSYKYGKREYLSTGTELTFDIIPLRAMMPIGIGCRYNYLHSFKEHAFEFIMSLNFDSF